MHHIDQTTSVDDVEDGVVQAERSLEFCVAIVFLREGEGLYLSNATITTSLIRQFITKMISDIAPALINS